MENTNFKADRSNWGRGPWDEEPMDRVDFIHVGFSCFVQRGPLGAWCGYVGVPSTHPNYGQDYDDVQAEVHGGLTYADVCQGSICHVPEPGMPDDVWWLGFDCAHSGDTVPGMSHYRDRYDHEYYKDLQFVTDETKALAEQLRGKEISHQEVSVDSRICRQIHGRERSDHRRAQD